MSAEEPHISNDNSRELETPSKTPSTSKTFSILKSTDPESIKKRLTTSKSRISKDSANRTPHNELSDHKSSEAWQDHLMESKIFPELNKLEGFPLNPANTLKLLEYSLYMLAHCKIPATFNTEGYFLDAESKKTDILKPSEFEEGVRAALTTLLTPASPTAHFHYTSGNVSNGQTILGIPNGQSFLTQTDGGVYNGHIYNGMKEGAGSINYTEQGKKDFFTGFFYDGMKHGYGVYRNGENESETQGTYQDNKMHGVFYTCFKRSAHDKKYTFQFTMFEQGRQTGDFIWSDHDKQNLVLGRMQDGKEHGLIKRFTAQQTKYYRHGMEIRDKEQIASMKNPEEATATAQ